MSKMTGCINRGRPTSAAAVVAVAALALFLAQAALAFHQVQFLALRQNMAISKSPAYELSRTPKGRSISMSTDGSSKGRSRAPAAAASAVAPFSLPTVLEEGPLYIHDPQVRETDKGYALTFNLPAEVTEDGLDVSVSGRLLTIEARVTRESNDDIKSKSAGMRDRGWVIARHTTRTYATSRSFTLPDGVFNQVTAYLVADGVVEVHLRKVFAGLTTPEETHPRHAAYFPDSSSSSSNTDGEIESSSSRPSPFTAMEDSGGVPVERRCDDERSSRSDASTSTSKQQQQQQQQHRSLLAALDDEFRDLAKAMLTGKDAMRFPTEEHVAATVERAREERERRVTALRRETMATSVSENDLAYVVTVALPDGATRDDVKLMVSPDNNGLHVTFSAEGHRTMSKAVRLPFDALFEDISATFSPEKATTSSSSASASTSASERGGRPRGRAAGVSKTKKRGGGGVSGLDITVGRVPPQLPKSIEIK